MWEALASIAGVLGAMAAIIRWLLQEYFKKAKELEETKKSLQEKVLDELKSTVDEHKKELRILGSKIQVSTTSLNSVDVDLKSVTLKLNEYHQESKQRIEFLESRLIKLSDDLLMVKGVVIDKKKSN